MTTTEITAAERAQLDAQPVSDADLADDVEVRDIEARIAAGDTKVTAAELAAARTDAAGRVRFARLRGLLAERIARRDAEQVEREQAAAAIERARDALAGHTDAELVSLFDAAEAALDALTRAVVDRNRELVRLVALPVADRVRGVDARAVGQHGPQAARLPLPEGEVRTVQFDTLIRAVLERAGISARNMQPIDRDRYPRNDRDHRDPEVIARGRAQLADRG